MRCPVCGRPARGLHVDEQDPEGVRVTWLCPNPACSQYKQPCAQQVQNKRIDPADKPV